MLDYRIANWLRRIAVQMPGADTGFAEFKCHLLRLLNAGAIANGLQTVRQLLIVTDNIAIDGIFVKLFLDICLHIIAVFNTQLRCIYHFGRIVLKWA